MVAEADESDRSFLKLSPTIAVVTNIDREHMDAYGSFERLVDAFVDFADRVPFYGAVVACVDDPPVARCCRRLDAPRSITYGFARGRRRARAWTPVTDGASGRCDVRYRIRGVPGGDGRGRADACTCRAATTCRTRWRPSPSGSSWACRSIGIARRSRNSAAPSAATRCAADRAGVTVVDDYGHHPTEIAAVLRAARDGRAGAARRGVPAAPLHAHARSARRVRPRARAGRRRRADRHLRRRRGADSRRHARRAGRARCATRAHDVARRAAARRRAGGGRATRAARRSGHHARRRIDRHGAAIAFSAALGAGGRVDEPRTARRASRTAGHAAGVAAPADSRFRRPDVRPARRRSSAQLAVARWAAWRSSPALAAARRLAWRSADVLGVAAAGGQPPRGPRQRAAVDRRGARRSLDGLERQEHPARRPRRVPPAADGLALGRRRDAVARAAVDRRGADRRARADGHRPARQQLYLVDDAGVIIDEFGPQYREFDLPIVDGLVRRRPSGGGRGRCRSASQLTQRFLEALRPRRTLRQRVSQIDVSDAHDVVVLLDDDPRCCTWATTRFLERLETYLELAPTLQEQFASIDYVDLRFDERVVRAVRRRGDDGEGDGAALGTTRGRSDEGEHGMREENDIWSGSTSARRRSSAIVGEVMDDGSLDIIGIGLAESKGIRRGVVNNVDSAAEAIKRALDEAELTAGVEIDSVYLALSGAHVKAFNSRGVVAVAGRNREITREDVKRAIDAARAVALPGGREILHVLPQDFVVDDQDGIAVPVGHDRQPARGQRARRHRQLVVDAEHDRVREPRRRRGRRHRARAARGQRSGADAGREGTGRGARRHRRRHDRLRGLRARQPVAHRRAGGRRRPLHERHRGRPADADSRRREAQAPLRLRADGARARGRDDGGREHRRPPRAR